jgi:hypothetical protein
MKMNKAMRAPKAQKGRDQYEWREAFLSELDGIGTPLHRLERHAASMLEKLVK